MGQPSHPPERTDDDVGGLQTGRRSEVSRASNGTDHKKAKQYLPPEVAFVLLIVAWLGLTSAVLLDGFLWAGDTAIAELTTREVDIKLHPSFDIVPDVIEVPQYTDLVLNVENIDTTQHDLQVTSNIGTRRLKPGEQVVLPVGYLNRDITIWCSIKGHREQGMQALITIVNDEPVNK